MFCFVGILTLDDHYSIISSVLKLHRAHKYITTHTRTINHGKNKKNVFRQTTKY